MIQKEVFDYIDVYKKIKLYSEFAKMVYYYGNNLSVFVDTEKNGVICPEEFLNKKEQVMFLIGINLPNPVTVFSLQENILGGITTNIQFGSNFKDCYFPWHSIIALCEANNVGNIIKLYIPEIEAIDVKKPDPEKKPGLKLVN